MARVDELSVGDIRKRFLDSPEPVSAQILSRLQRDPRQGVQRLYAALKKRFEREREERVRMDAMRHFASTSFRSRRPRSCGSSSRGAGR